MKKRHEFRRRIASGSAIFSNPVWAEIARSLHFTFRELQIIRAMFDDKTEYATAADLGISVHTVHTHLERLRHKLRVKDRAALILRVIEEFIDLTDAAGSGLPPICGKRTAGLCRLRDRAFTIRTER
jgi:DNA-binding CsgD family transcriptional regulator